MSKFAEHIFNKLLLMVMLMIIVHLQSRLWFGDGSIEQINTYQLHLDVLRQQAQTRLERNQSLYGQVLDLRKGQEAIEEIARYDLGMIGKDETFFQIIK